jgi:murein DD-endopeptidase MepM/ murein hydrolase activator NlpD
MSNGVNSNYSVGQTVLANNVLGYSGNTGTSTGSHLHAAIHFSSIDDNPYANWLYQQDYLDKYDKSNWYSDLYNFMR